MSEMPEELPEIFRRTENVVELRTEAALKAIWEAMPWKMEIALPGGEEATLEKFVAPRKSVESGVWEFGFDVRETTGCWHIEFFASKTGWGAAPIEPVEIQS